MRNISVLRRTVRASLAAALPLLFIACATPIPDGEAGQPLTVRLPLRNAHVSDGRAVFAAAFQR
jgi:hypothetical protein